ncbi:MAG: NADH-quinone oxidoreductase subunit A [Alphaproteobacteria bacterium]|jgi:NADH-quinone oxidoreductase subunit A
MGNMAHSYFYFMVFFIVALVLSAAFLKLAFSLNKTLSALPDDAAGKESYAGGFRVLSRVYLRFPVRFALVALLFILFNTEILLLLPWAMALRLSGWEGFGVASVLLIFWGVGYVYVFRKGALEWR